MKRLAIIGATGLVGQTTIKVLYEEKLFDKFEIFMFGSNQSAGKVLVFKGKHFTLYKLDESIFNLNLDYAIFLTNEDVSRIWVKRLSENGIVCIDNSSAFRLCDGVPLVVPEINMPSSFGISKIIANPNCSTIQLVVVLDRLMKICKIKQVVVSSYQSVSGAGKDALLDLENDTKNVFTCGIRNNIIAQIGSLQTNENSSEENKIINETKKILNFDAEIFATAVRVPISYCHGESVYVLFEKKVDIEKIKQILKTDYICVGDDLFYPKDIAGSNKTFVIRIRKAGENGIQFFVIADNLRRGAGYNAVKILQKLVETNQK